MSDDVQIVERGVLALSADAWEEARRRAALIGPLATGPVSHGAADAAAEQLGLSRRQVYVLVKSWRQGSGLVTDLAVARSDGGRGGGRLPEAVEAVIGEVLRTRYMTRQRPTLAAVYGDVVRACKAEGLRVPARNTVASRIELLHPTAVAQAQEGNSGGTRSCTRPIRKYFVTRPPGRDTAGCSTGGAAAARTAHDGHPSRPRRAHLERRNLVRCPRPDIRGATALCRGRGLGREPSPPDRRGRVNPQPALLCRDRSASLKHLGTRGRAALWCGDTSAAKGRNGAAHGAAARSVDAKLNASR